MDLNSIKCEIEKIIKSSGSTLIIGGTLLKVIISKGCNELENLKTFLKENNTNLFYETGKDDESKTKYDYFIKILNSGKSHSNLFKNGVTTNMKGRFNKYKCSCITITFYLFILILIGSFWIIFI